MHPKAWLLCRIDNGVHSLADFLFAIDFGRAAESGKETPEKRTSVGESRPINNLVDRQPGRHEQLLGKPEATLLDDVDRGLSGDSP